MRICFVGPASSSHMEKWCGWFGERGHEVHLISFTQGRIENTRVHMIDIGIDVHGSDIRKIKYLFAGKQIRRLIERIRPDVINVHYATSYGTAVAFSGVKGYILSVWGSDIYDFPRKSVFHRLLLQYSLKRAAYLFSTSRAMANEAARYTNKEFDITPFGVDMKLFHPDKRTREGEEPAFVVGTVKGLSDKYGIRNILEAVAQIHKAGDIPIRLRIAGRGEQEQEYRDLAERLGIQNITTWLGYISQEQAAVEWANMDIAIIPSTLESFGVSAVEAQASGTPVIISDVPGLMEATLPEKTSVVVEKNNSHELSDAIMDLIKDAPKRHQMGISGRQYVEKKYSIDNCFKKVEGIFESLI